MSIQSPELIKQAFFKYFNLYLGKLNPEKVYIEDNLLCNIIDIAVKNPQFQKDFSNIIINSLLHDEICFKRKVFPIIDSLIKKMDVYLNDICQHLEQPFIDCFFSRELSLEDRDVLFKIFYNWKYIIPDDLFQRINIKCNIDEYKKDFSKRFPEKIQRYEIELSRRETQRKMNSLTKHNNNINIKEQNKVLPITKTFQEDQSINKISKKKKKEKKEKKEKTFLNKKIKPPQTIEQSLSILGEILNTPINPKLNENNNLIISPNEIKIFNLLVYTNVKLDINCRLFSSLAKYYNEITLKKNDIHLKTLEDLYNQKEEFKKIKQNVESKLFGQKNFCSICGFRTMFYENLTRHLDIHFYYNYLEMYGKNVYRKIGNNKKNWITGNKNNMNDSLTLGHLLYYKNVMNDKQIKMSNEHEVENEEFIYPINEEIKEKCNYCGDDFIEVFSSKYQYWFYDKVVQVRDENKKVLFHQDCYEELVKCK